MWFTFSGGRISRVEEFLHTKLYETRATPL